MSKPKSFDLKIKYRSLVVDQETTVALIAVNMRSGKSHHDSTRNPFRPEETMCLVAPCGILEHLTRLDAELVNPKNAFQAKLWKRLGNRLHFHIKELRHNVFVKRVQGWLRLQICSRNFMKLTVDSAPPSCNLLLVLSCLATASQRLRSQKMLQWF